MRLSNYSSKPYKSSFLLPFILNDYPISLPDNAEPLMEFALLVFKLSLISLLNFCYLLGYLTSIYLINKNDITVKYPKL